MKVIERNSMKAFIDGYNQGYRLGMHAKKLKIPLSVLGKSIVSKTYFDEYSKGLHFGYNEAFMELKKQMIKARKMEMDRMMTKELDRDGPTMKF